MFILHVRQSIVETTPSRYELMRYLPTNFMILSNISWLVWHIVAFLEARFPARSGVMFVVTAARCSPRMGTTQYRLWSAAMFTLLLESVILGLKLSNIYQRSREEKWLSRVVCNLITYTWKDIQNLVGKTSKMKISDHRIILFLIP